MTAPTGNARPTGSLLERFERFIRTVPGFESVDDLLKDQDPHGMKRADYLLHGRSVIVEQKALEVDPEEKGQRYMDGLMQERRILAYGRLAAHVILEGQSDAAALNRRLHQRLTQVIESDMSSADKQTRDTREIFGLKGAREAGGLLVLLNDAAHTLDPNLVCHRIAHLLQERRPDGGLRFPCNRVVLYVQESHALGGNRADLIPIVMVRGPEWNMALQVEGVAGSLMAGWTAFNGLPLIEHAGDLSALQRLRRRPGRAP